MALFLLNLALAAGFLPTALAQIALRNSPDPSASISTVSALDFSDAASFETATFKGVNFGCKCYPGERCWPSAAKWNSLNGTVNGRLHVHIPPGASCYNTFKGPLGIVNTYNEAACANVNQNWYNQFWT